MNIINNFISPNIHKVNIPVEFVVIHYTACDLQKTLEIFMNPNSKVSSHFVIDTDGDCYDLGNFLNGPIQKGAHAGLSRIEIDDSTYSALNDISIGIELINLNGNIFPYTNEQYECLEKLLKHFQTRFPALNNSSRIIGHEHIAYWRGKADPGLQFEWERLLRSINLKSTAAHNFYACDENDLDFIRNEIANNEETSKQSNFWPELSGKLEKRIKEKFDFSLKFKP